MIKVLVEDKFVYAYFSTEHEHLRDKWFDDVLNYLTDVMGVLSPDEFNIVYEIVNRKETYWVKVERLPEFTLEETIQVAKNRLTKKYCRLLAEIMAELQLYQVNKLGKLTYALSNIINKQ